MGLRLRTSLSWNLLRDASDKHHLSALVSMCSDSTRVTWGWAVKYHHTKCLLCHHLEFPPCFHHSWSIQGWCRAVLKLLALGWDFWSLWRVADTRLAVVKSTWGLTWRKRVPRHRAGILWDLVSACPSACPLLFSFLRVPSIWLTEGSTCSAALILHWTSRRKEIKAHT